jgi:hypothetical protein
MRPTRPRRPLCLPTERLGSARLRLLPPSLGYDVTSRHGRQRGGNNDLRITVQEPSENVLILRRGSSASHSLGGLFRL